jgi:hypothetical protein
MKMTSIAASKAFDLEIILCRKSLFLSIYQISFNFSRVFFYRKCKNFPFFFFNFVFRVITTR